VHLPVIAFDKLDGSNIRCEWNRKKGLHKFGSRKVLLGADHTVLGKAESYALAKYGDALGRIFTAQRWPETTCFFEFHGPRSFAGLHEPDDAHTVTLIDVSVLKQGMLRAREFVKLFGDVVEIPRVLHDGNPTQDFIDAVKNSTLSGMTYEGVVCKGAPLKNGYPPHMWKLKSLAWIQAVKALYGEDSVKLTDLL
jgi:hypothetical protein